MFSSVIIRVARLFGLAFLSLCSVDVVAARQLNFEQYAFRRDVVRRAEERARLIQEVRRLEDLRLNSPMSFTSSNLDEILMEKAIPIEEYEDRLRTAGAPGLLRSGATDNEGIVIPDFMKIETQVNSKHQQRRLEDKDECECEEDDEDCNCDDDYVMDDGEMYDFAGYSLKYATCQKIARFSSNAVLNGEYSALVTDDIVFLRLCPKRRCSSSMQWGCNNGYGEYALELRDYLNIMLRYQVQKQEAVCTFCGNCASGNYYNNQEGGNDDNVEDDNDENEDEMDDDDQDRKKRVLEDAQDDANAYDDGVYAYDDDGNDANGNDDGGNDYGNYGNDPCDTYVDLCDELQSEGSCAYGNDNQDDDSLNYLDYIDYFDCVQVKGAQGGAFYVSPRCDPHSTKIQMGIFYDPYCSQFAGNEYNLNEFSGVNFNNDVFEDFYSGECISCAKSNDPPYYNVNSNVCNKVYRKSGQCNTYLAVSLDDDDAYDKSSNSEAVCSFIDSVRFGSFDSNGEIITSGSQYGSEVRGEVTIGQTVGLIFTCLVCGGLALYSCYLHHSITNVLLKSLSHGPLVSSDRSTRSKKSRRSQGGSRSRRDERDRDDENDWDYQMS